MPSQAVGPCASVCACRAPWRCHAAIGLVSSVVGAFCSRRLKPTRASSCGGTCELVGSRTFGFQLLTFDDPLLIRFGSTSGPVGTTCTTSSNRGARAVSFGKEQLNGRGRPFVASICSGLRAALDEEGKIVGCGWAAAGCLLRAPVRDKWPTRWTPGCSCSTNKYLCTRTTSPRPRHLLPPTEPLAERGGRTRKDYVLSTSTA